MAQQLIYGIHVIEMRLKQQPQTLYFIAVLEGVLSKRLEAIVMEAQQLGVKVNFVPKEAFNKINGVHQGIFAEVSKTVLGNEKQLMTHIDKADNPVCLFLDEIQDPHNLGAILRTADAAGVHAVVIPKNRSADLNETVFKVACGGAETVAVFRVTNLVRSIKDLQAAGMWIIGLAGETNKTIYEMEYKGAIGLVLGKESSGLRKSTREACDFLAAIPMFGSVESLNVSVATGITLFEALRQRSV